MESVVDHIATLFGILDAILDISLRLRVRELRFTQYGKKQAMHDICERIMSGGGFEDDMRPVTVPFPYATITTRGRFSGPVKAARRHLQKRGEDMHLVNDETTL